jgi:hypothetical protein
MRALGHEHNAELAIVYYFLKVKSEDSSSQWK